MSNKPTIYFTPKWWRDLTVLAKYFIIAILGIGSIGVWLPVLLALALKQEVNFAELPINLTTFYISIYFAGCVDYFLKILDNKDQSSKSDLLNYLALILLAIILVTTTIWLKIEGYFFVPLCISLFGTFIGLFLWWRNNVDNPMFIDVRDKRNEEQETITNAIS